MNVEEKREREREREREVQKLLSQGTCPKAIIEFISCIKPEFFFVETKFIVWLLECRSYLQLIQARGNNNLTGQIVDEKNLNDFHKIK